MHKIIFLPVALLFFSSARAQEAKLSYFGETFTHYGVKGAYSLPLYSWEKTNRREKTRNSALVFSPGLAIYRHTGNHIGVIVMPEVSYKTVNQKGSLFETGISPGLFRSFYEGQTFEVSKESTLREGQPLCRHSLLALEKISLYRSRPSSPGSVASTYSNKSPTTNPPLLALPLKRASANPSLLENEKDTHTYDLLGAFCL